ncbi:MAG: PHP domain-containing protein [Planctomycetota bacterium]
MRLVAPAADLHVHSTCSDGLDAPATLVNRASGRLSLLSICDHDTLRAYDDPATNANAIPGVRILPGIEISAVVGDDELHILGYFPSGLSAELRAFVIGLESARRCRILDGVAKLRARGLGLRLDLLEDVVGEGVPCRSHVCRALIRIGVARNPAVVFRRFLGRDVFEPPEVSVAEAIEQIHRSQGIAIWAHPRIDHLSQHLATLLACGIDGLEVDSPSRRGTDRRRLRELCVEHELLSTGGSDYHGAHNSTHRQLGAWRFPIEYVPVALRCETPLC